MSRISQSLSDLEQEHRRSPSVERAISRLIDMEVPQSFEALPYFRTIDPALDFMITFPARSQLQQQFESPPLPGSVFSSTETERCVRRARTYFHIPFCQDICKYCIFFIRYGSDDHAEHYLKALKQEWQQISSLPMLRTMVSRELYVGGGTPTALSLEHLDLLTDMIQSNVRLEPGAEYTFEAHPASVTPEKLELLAERGVNRISMGVESFDNQALELCGRVGYTRDDVPIVLEMIRRAGITNVNIDMIYGLPGETLSKFADTLEYLTELFDADLLTAVSWYPYTTRKTLPEWPKGHFLPDSLDMLLMSAMIREALVNDLDSTESPARYFEPRRYSNGTKKNPTVDWDRVVRDWLSEYEDVEIGCGNYAYSYVDAADQSYVNQRGVKRYIKRVEAGELPVATELHLTHELKLERAVLKACQIGFVNLTAIEETFEFNLLQEKRGAIDEMVEHRLVEVTDGQIFVTEKGKLNLEAVARKLAFMPGRYQVLSGA
ncbi:MAG: coproporphyrinogen-III oxidase family protein [bacterium]